MSKAAVDGQPVPPFLTSRRAVKPKRTQLELVSGRFLDFNDPRPEDIVLEDIAHALSNICRWGGHCPHFVSVAEHACLVHDIVAARCRNTEERWGALHHDDHEAFIGDLPTPLKNMIGEKYYKITDALDRAIGKALVPNGVFPHIWFKEPIIKAADNLALFIEAERVKPSKGLNWSDRPSLVELPAGVTWACGWEPATARVEYLRRHRALSPS